MNAAERFLAASHAHDLDAATSELAPDVVMINPATNDPVTGRESVAVAIRSVDAACDEFRHPHLLSSHDSGEPALFGLVFEAKVSHETLHGVDLLEVDADDRGRRFTVIARPISALMALGARMPDPSQ